MDNKTHIPTEGEKFCCFIYLAVSLILGTYANVYILDLLGVAWNQVIMWIVIMFFSLFTAWLSVPLAVIIWIINKIIS
jgi:hypothetical protein